MPDDMLVRAQGSTAPDARLVCRIEVEAALARLEAREDGRPRMILGLIRPGGAGIEIRVAEGAAKVPGDGWVLGAMRPGDLHDAGRRAALIDRLTIEATRVLLRDAACSLSGSAHVRGIPRRSPLAPTAWSAPVVAPLPAPRPVASSVTLAEIEARLSGWSEAELTRLRDLAAAELARRAPPAPADGGLTP